MNTSAPPDRLHVLPPRITRTGRDIKLSVTIQGPDKTLELWYLLPERCNPFLTTVSDPFVIAVLFYAMRRRLDISVHGPVTKTLLENLEEFQQIWTNWKPKQYQKVNILPESVIGRPVSRQKHTLMTFSGGLDSCYTAWQYNFSSRPSAQKKPEAAVLVHGFNIPLTDTAAFNTLTLKSQKILDSIGLEMIPLKCNFRELFSGWEDSHAAALASCLQIFSGRFSTGLIASSHAYNSLRLPWGSNPLTDPMLSGNFMEIINHGGEKSRWQKAEAVSSWKEAVANLQVCWRGKKKGTNCGACVTCITTAFYFAAAKGRYPAVLNIGSIEKALKKLYALPIKPVGVKRLDEFLNDAEKSGRRKKWLADLDRCRNFHKKRLRRPKTVGKIMLLGRKLLYAINSAMERKLRPY